MDFQLLLRFAVQNNASDVHLQSGLRPCVRVGGIIHMTDQPPVTDEAVRNFIAEIAPPRMRSDFEDRLAAGMDFSYAPQGLSRFRCSAFRHLGLAGISMRIIKSHIPCSAG